MKFRLKVKVEFLFSFLFLQVLFFFFWQCEKIIKLINDPTGLIKLFHFLDKILVLWRRGDMAVRYFLYFDNCCWTFVNFLQVERVTNVWKDPELCDTLTTPWAEPPQKNRTSPPELTEGLHSSCRIVSRRYQTSCLWLASSLAILKFHCDVFSLL